MLNGNILAARTFIVHFVSQLTARRPSLLSPHQPTPIPVGEPTEGEADEIVFTTDSTLNFAQLAVRVCQRAQGDKNKAMREAWVRLCGTYQSKGGLVANREVRKVGNRAAQSSASLPSTPFRVYTTTRRDESGVRFWERIAPAPTPAAAASGTLRVRATLPYPRVIR